MRNIISKFFFTLLALTMGIGQVWGACATAGTIYKFATKSSLSATTSITDNPVSITTSNYLSELTGSTGAALSAHNESSKFQIASNGMKLADKSKSYLIVDLGECTLKAGDVIKTIVTGQNLYLCTEANSSKSKLTITKSSNNSTYMTAVMGEDVNQSVFYLMETSNSAIVYSFEVIRPYTITLNATENGGTAVDPVKGISGDKVVLPHAFKDGYKFKGWFTTPTGSIKQQNYYTISGNREFYAQFESLPTEGEIFSFVMDADLKPAANCTIKNSAGFVSEQDMLAYAAISGGSAIVYNSSTSNHAIITTDPKLQFAGSSAYLNIKFEQALQEGDQITTTISDQNIAYTTTGTRNTANYFTKGNNQVLTITKNHALDGATEIYLWAASSSGGKLSSLSISRPAPAATYTVTLNPAGGTIDPVPSGWTLTAGQYIKADVEDGSSVALLALTKDGYVLDGWKDGENNPYTSPVTIDGADLTLTAQWASAHTVSFAANGGGGSMLPVVVKDGVTYTIPACGFTPEDANHTFSHWAISGVPGKTEGDPDETFTMPAGDVTLTAQWTVSYDVTKGSHTNGDFTISPASGAAGTEITLSATGNEGYMLGSWEVVKTSDGTASGVTVTNNKFNLPAFDVTVNATFVTDTRPKVLYLTTTSEADTKANDKLYAALKDAYNVTIAAPNAQTLTDYALVVLHESIGGTNTNAAVTGCKTTTVPVLNTKSYFYNNANTTDQRWNWGTPNAGTSVNGATQNSAYCNIASHPLFAGVTVTDGFFEITDEAAAKCMQPIGAFTTGLEGYTLATTPNASEGNGCAIHEIPAGNSVRGAGTGKYLMISVSNAKLNALNANGQKLFQNAADYLINGTAWEPVVAPTLSSSVPANSAIDVAVAGNIVLTFSQNVSVLDASKFTLSGGAGSLTTASISVSGAVVTIPYSGLDNSTEYTLATAAGAVKNGSDVPNAALSNIVFTTEAACTKPEAPVSLAASNITHTSADLSWDPLGAGANGYKISIIKKDDETVILDWTDVATNSYEETGLTQGTTYTLKVKYKGTGAQCEFSNEVTLDFTTTAPSVADLVTIADDYTFTPSVAIPAGTLTADNKFFAAGASDCDMSGGKMRVKTNRALAFKVADGAKIKVTFTQNGSRQIQLGNSLTQNSNPEGNYYYGYSTTSPYTFDVVATGGVVYLTAYSDQLYFSKLEIMYPHTVTYDLNGGTGTTPTQASKYVGETFSVHDGVTDITAPASKDFDKWVDQDAANVAAGATYTMPAKNVTLTAQWVDHIEPVDPTLTYDDGAYSVGGSALDLSTLITAQTSTGAITYSVKTDGGTSASIDGNNFTATAAGTATITASQAAVYGYNAKTVDFNVVVTEPAEKDGIKMVVAGALTGHFRVKADQLKTGSYTVDGINYTKYVQMGSTHTSFSGETEGNQAKGIYYAPAKKNIKFWFYMRNTDSSTRKIYIYKMEEGSAITSATVDVDPGSQLVSYDMTLATNAEVIFGVENTKLYFCQIVAVESGEDLLQGGQNGYVFDYSKKRQNVAANTLRTIDGIDYKLSAESKINSASNVQLTTLGTHYIKFHLDAPMTVNVYADNKKYYVGTECSTEDAAMTYEATGDGEFTLAAGNWYINGSGAQVKINKLSFMLPKCEAPAFNALANSDICSGDPYVALDGTGTVSDGGTITYKWYAHGADESDPAAVLATTATYTPEADGNYYVKALHHVDGYTDNEATSDEVTVTSHAGTAITSAPANVRKSVGEDATLEVVATGKNVAYEWFTCDDAMGTNPVAIVPAETNATLDVTVPDGIQYYMVVVSSDCGANVSAVAKVEKFVALPQVHISGTTEWDLTTCADAQIQLTSTTSPKKGEECLMANIEGVHLDANFNSQALVMSGEYIYRTSVTGNPTCAEYMKFITDVEGVVTITFAGNGDNRLIRVTGANGVQYSTVSTGTGDTHTEKFYVTPGEVELMGMNDAKTETKKYMRFFSISFNATPDYTRTGLTVGKYGTTCLPSNVPAGAIFGAEVYKLLYWKYGTSYEDCQMVEFEQVETMNAGEPYLILPTEETFAVFYGDITVAYPQMMSNGFIGTFVEIVAAPDNELVGKYGIVNNMVQKLGENCHSAPNRAYIDLSQTPSQSDYESTHPKTSTHPKRLSLGHKSPQITTGLDAINVDAEGIQKVLVNGQLYIVRGGQIYTATGQLVK